MMMFKDAPSCHDYIVIAEMYKITGITITDWNRFINSSKEDQGDHKATTVLCNLVLLLHTHTTLTHTQTLFLCFLLFPNCILVKSVNFEQSSLLPCCLPSKTCQKLNLIYVFITLLTGAENYLRRHVSVRCVTPWTLCPRFLCLFNPA